MYEGLVIDVDYLLNAVQELKISFDRKLKTLNLLIEKNIPIVLYSDNNKEYIDSIMKHLRVKEPAIIAGGAQIYSPFEKAYEEMIPLSINTVCQLGNWASNQNLDAIISTDRAVMNYGAWAKDLKETTYIGIRSKFSNVVKIEIYIRNDDKRIEFLNFIGKNNLECSPHMYLNHVSCINYMVDKGNTLKYLAKRKNWNIKKFAVLGDHYRDASIFDEVGYIMSISDFVKDFQNNFEIDSDMLNIV
ncbi:HAD hydrolase family protein [Clostridium felsineum]|uniref:HAD hydrolase family protein n=1 Tax=Clostridium felsineum TaxID=36839 RepID=UPI00098CEF93|nr:HAD hydrolase family protein [Clostridium felsineum]URZ16715.1 hypothetical protein CLFE_027620 [Clostridium felsineum DSM 794]